MRNRANKAWLAWLRKQQQQAQARVQQYNRGGLAWRGDTNTGGASASAAPVDWAEMLNRHRHRPQPASTLQQPQPGTKQYTEDHTRYEQHQGGDSGEASPSQSKPRGDDQSSAAGGGELVATTDTPSTQSRGGLADEPTHHRPTTIQPGSKQDTEDRARYEQRLAQEQAGNQQRGATQPTHPTRPRGQNPQTPPDDISETHWSSTDDASSSGGPEHDADPDPDDGEEGLWDWAIDGPPILPLFPQDQAIFHMGVRGRAQWHVRIRPGHLYIPPGRRVIQRPEHTPRHTQPNRGLPLATGLDGELRKLLGADLWVLAVTNTAEAREGRGGQTTPGAAPLRAGDFAQITPDVPPVGARVQPSIVTPLHNRPGAYQGEPEGDHADTPNAPDTNPQAGSTTDTTTDTTATATTSTHTQQQGGDPPHTHAEPDHTDLMQRRGQPRTPSHMQHVTSPTAHPTPTTSTHPPATPEGEALRHITTAMEAILLRGGRAETTEMRWAIRKAGNHLQAA